MIETAIVLIVVALVMMSIGLAARNLTNYQRAGIFLTAAGISSIGSVLAFLSSHLH